MKRTLPLARVASRPDVGYELSPSALARFNPTIRAAARDEAAEPTITLFGTIGYDWWTETDNSVKRVNAALRSIGDRDLTVAINSPGGDYFEGLAIYNALRDHPRTVTVKVLGLAASAASIIAMAGDKVMMPRAGFMMIHNVWAVGIGNRHDFREMADMLEPFDGVLADLYQTHTGIDRAEIEGMLDRETWIGGAEAVDKGFADELLPADQLESSDDEVEHEDVAAHKMDLIMAKAGVTRSERRRLIKNLKGSTPSAAPTGTPGAADPGTAEAVAAGLSELLARAKSTTFKA